MTNTNTSDTGGYLLPTTENDIPQCLTFEDFLQSVLVGISGMPGPLVRAKWQVNPPKQPDIGVDWISFGLGEVDADSFAYTNDQKFMRMEALVLQCTFYGPNSLAIAQGVRDGFQIPQNTEALRSAKLDFVSTTKMTRVPDLVNERWVNRWEMGINLRREILRSYSILSLLSASGTLYALGDSGLKTIPLNVKGT